MTDTDEWTEGHPAALQVRCPVCDAAPGDNCADGHDLKQHAERFDRRVGVRAGLVAPDSDETIAINHC